MSDKPRIEQVARSHVHQVERIEVPGGWLYTLVAAGPGGHVACHSTFVPEDRPQIPDWVFPPRNPPEVP